MAELRAARSAAWSTTEALAARVTPRRSPKWWGEACCLGRVPGAVRDVDSGKWRVPAATVEGYEVTGILPVLPRLQRAAGRP